MKEPGFFTSMLVFGLFALSVVTGLFPLFVLIWLIGMLWVYVLS